MLGVLCASRPKPWLLSSLLSYPALHGSTAFSAHCSRLIVSRRSPINWVIVNSAIRDQKWHHSSACRLSAEKCGTGGGGAASIWHAILPASGDVGHLRRRGAVIGHYHDNEVVMQKGEGSWNVAWDARPARWLHNPDSAWLLFGVCACLAAPAATILDLGDANSDEKVNGFDSADVSSGAEDPGHSPNYRVTGVTADGRCLFRAIAHVACLRNGEAAPDENRQRELADELRAQVVDELLKRRKEAEWFIEGDFDAYVKRIQQPYVWGGEPELLMASHVLKTPISVFMIDRSSGSLTNIANYGEEYKKDEESPIKVLFHGYGHYDILEAVPDQSYQKVEV